MVAHWYGLPLGGRALGRRCAAVGLTFCLRLWGLSDFVGFGGYLVRMPVWPQAADR
jgi:hypothetical protein